MCPERLLRKGRLDSARVRLDPGIEQDIAILFREVPPLLRDRIAGAYAVFGLGPAAADQADQAQDLDPGDPVDDRLRRYEADLRRGLHVCAQQLDEFDPSDPYVTELRGRGFATLIALRELYRHFPEVFG